MVSDVMLCDLPFPVSSTHLCCAHTLCLTVFGNKQYIHTYITLIPEPGGECPPPRPRPLEH